MLRLASNSALIEMTRAIDLPPEFKRLADLLNEQLPEVRDLFRYALVLAMIDDEKAWITGTRYEEDQEPLTASTGGDAMEATQ